MPFSTRSLLCAAVVVLLVVLLATHLGEGPRRLSGFWVGEPGFLEEAGLVDAYLYVAPAKGLGAKVGYTSHDAFLVLATAQGLVCNQALRVSPSFGPGLWRRDTLDARARLEFSDPDELPAALAEPAPGDFHVRLEPEGALALHAGGKLLAYFTKDAAATRAAEEAAN